MDNNFNDYDYMNSYVPGYDMYSPANGYDYGNMQPLAGGCNEFAGTSNDVITYERMLELGFEPIVMQTREFVLNNYGKLSSKAFQVCGVYDRRLIQDIQYADKIMTGAIPVNNKADLKKHLLKMNLDRKIGIGDLTCSIQYKTDLKAMIGGLPAKSIFGLYNTIGTDEKYVDVETLAPNYVTIRSPKYYKISARQSRTLYRVKDLLNNKHKFYESMDSIEPAIKNNPTNYTITRVAELQNIQSINGTNYVTVVIHRDYCRIAGRYMIVASLKAPDLHLGCYEMLTLGGTTVYVFAKQVKFNQKAEVRYSTGAERVYYIGCDYENLDNTLATITTQLYQKVKGVYSEKIEPTAEFIEIEPYESNRFSNSNSSAGSSTSEDSSETSGTPSKRVIHDEIPDDFF